MDNSPPSCSACGAWWRLPLALAIVLAAILSVKRLPRDDGPPQPPAENAASKPAAASPDAPAQPVSLTIRFGEGTEPLNDDIDWSRGLTVRDAMRQVQGVELEEQGSGQAAFLTSINGVGNEGAGGRNWIYSVNGTGADRSYAVFEVEPGDRILWTFVTRQ